MGEEVGDGKNPERSRVEEVEKEEVGKRRKMGKKGKMGGAKVGEDEVWRKMK
jgi:hypothetical protein